MTRLQGKEFQAKKRYLTMLGYQISKGGHIRAIMKLKTDTKTKIGDSTKHMYSHYLNPDEEKVFRASEYFKTHESIENEVLYAKFIAKERRRQEKFAREDAKEQEKYNSIPQGLIEDIKKLKGLPPYENKRLPNGEVVGTNYCEGDGYFAASLKEKYGKEAFDLAYEYIH